MDLNPKIVDTAGRERYAFGGEHALDTGIYRGYCWSKEWFIGSRSTEPMLAIWPMGMQREAAGVWGICLSSAGKYLTEAGGATPECTAMAKRALREMFDRPALGVDVSSLVHLVVRHLPDVILMTPAPAAARKASAGAPLIEIELINEFTGKTESEASV